MVCPGLSEADSMEYVEVRYGRPISRSYYYKVKNLLNSDTFVDKCFNSFGNIRSSDLSWNYFKNLTITDDTKPKRYYWSIHLKMAKYY